MLPRKQNEAHRRLADASAAYERACETSGPDSPAAAGALGFMLLQEGRYDEAAEAYQRVLDSGDPDRAAAARALGWIRHEQGRLEEAVAAYNLAITSDDPAEAAQAARSLGLLHWEQGQLDDATRAYQLAIDSGDREERAIALYDLGAVADAQDRLDDAARAYRLAIESGHPEAAGAAKHALRQLERRRSVLWRALDSDRLVFPALVGFIFLPGAARYVALGLFAVVVVAGFRRRGMPTTTSGRVNAALLIAGVVLLALASVGGASATVSAFLFIPVLAGWFVTLIPLDRELSAGISKARQVRFAIWCCAIATAAVIGTVRVVDQAPSHVADRALLPAGATRMWVAVILLVAFVGGLWVFRAQTQWRVVTLWVFFGALLTWLVQYPAWIFMGATHTHGVIGSCLNGHSCDQFAYVAGFIAYTSPVLVLAVFLAGFGVKRLVDRTGTRP